MMWALTLRSLCVCYPCIHYEFMAFSKVVQGADGVRYGPCESLVMMKTVENLL